jgi:integrase
MSSIVISPVRSLADVQARVRASGTLEAGDRNEIVSALNTLARVAGRPLETIPAEVGAVRDLVQPADFVRAGLKERYAKKIKYCVMKALALCGLKVLSNRGPELPADWAFVCSKAGGWRKVVLSRFARYCSENKLRPQDVTNEVFDDYERYLEAFSSRKTRRTTILSVRKIWNACCAAHPDWPGLQVEIVHRHDRYLQPLERFPASLHDSIEAWLAPPTKMDWFTQSKAPLRPSTVNMRRSTIYGFASACVGSGVRPESLTSLRALVSNACVLSGFAFLLDRAGGQPTEGLFNIADIPHGLAKHLQVEGADLLTLGTIRSNFRTALSSRGMTEKNKALLRAFEDEALVTAFLHLPEKLTRRFLKEKCPGQRSALLLEYALALEILSVAPIRIANLVTIRFDKHFQRFGDRRLLVFQPGEVKNKVALEYVLPSSTIALLELYLKKARPLRPHAASMFLFAGKVDGHRQAGKLSQQLAALTAAELGVRITAHQFRHLAGFLYLSQHPGEYETVRQLLGNTIEITMRFYAGMERNTAVRHYDKFLQECRAKLGSASVAKRGRSR